MKRLIAVGLLLASCQAFALPAASQQAITGPGYTIVPGPPPAERREAADQTLGMAVMSASIFLCSTMRVGAGVVSFSKVSNGVCDVKFARDVSMCTCTASFGVTGGGLTTSSVQNFISSNCGLGGADNARVYSFFNGSPSDSAFQLIVFCPK